MLRLEKYTKFLVYFFLIIYLVIILLPFTMMILNSFKTTREIFLYPFGLPESFSLSNFKDAWVKANIGRGYLNSALIACFSVIGILFTSTMFAFAISQFQFKGRIFLRMYAMLGLALPAQLAVIPIFLLLRNFSLTDTRTGLILVYIAVNFSFSVFILTNFMENIPSELIDEARIDGANLWQIYTKIVLPLVRPSLTIVGLVSFVNVWNDFFYPLILINSKSKATITLAVSIFFGEYYNQWNLLFSSLTLAIIPSIILYIIFSRQFIAGMTQGAFK